MVRETSCPILVLGPPVASATRTARRRVTRSGPRVTHTLANVGTETSPDIRRRAARTPEGSVEPSTCGNSASSPV